MLNPPPKPGPLASKDETIGWRPSQEHTPVASISCIAYNHEENIEDALNSFLNQLTTLPFKILINDDATISPGAFWPNFERSTCGHRILRHQAGLFRGALNV